MKAALALDDAAFYEWCTKEFGKGWNTSTPIKREENTFNYQLVVKSDNTVEVYASFSEAPASLYRIYGVADYDRYVSMIRQFHNRYNERCRRIYHC